jgi:hypothetical protein
MNGEAIHLKPGDIAVYRGIENEHWREPLTFSEPVWHVQAFLHYVDKNGPHADCKYDNRANIGELANSKKENKILQNKIPSYIEYVKY